MIAAVTELPTLDREIQAAVVKILEDNLEQARAGKLTLLFLVAERRDEKWAWQWSGAEVTTRLVGRSEIAKHELLAGLQDKPE